MGGASQIKSSHGYAVDSDNVSIHLLRRYGTGVLVYKEHGGNCDSFGDIDRNSIVVFEGSIQEPSSGLSE